MWVSPWLFFTDPVLRASTIGCMWMALVASLVGVVALVRRRALLGESLSHATYPGIILGAWLVAGSGGLFSAWLAPIALVGAFITALLGLWVIQQLEYRLGFHQDASLCLVLSTFFGVGIAMASRLQFAYTTAYQQVLSVLYGQAATMTDRTVRVYLVLALVTITLLVLLYKEIKVLCFDRQYARVLGLPIRRLDWLVFGLITLSIVIGIRSVGVVLMSAMLVAPPIAARQFSHRFGVVLSISGFIGVASGFLGNYLSVALSYLLTETGSRRPLALPTGPMIVLVAVAFCLLALVLAPEQGWLWRVARAIRFRYQCAEENLLKALWRGGSGAHYTHADLRQRHAVSKGWFSWVVWRLRRRGWLIKEQKLYYLSGEGLERATHVVRLHRLWEAYLFSCLGVGAERVHRSAEEMEHILTPELEAELSQLLSHPTRDPHAQPIPESGGRM